MGGDGASLPLSATNRLPVALAANQAALGVTGFRQDSDAPYAADLAAHPMLFNALGRLKVSVLPGDLDATVGTITANAQTIQVDTRRLGNITAMVSGTFAGVTLVFEASLDGTAWFGIQGARTNANVIEPSSGSLSATPAYAWEFGCAAFAWFRVRATTFTSGTQNVTLKGGANSTEPAPASQITGTQPVSGTVAVSALPAGTNLIGNTGVAAATYTDKSGTITAGGTAQTPFAINAARRGFLIQNNSAGDLWFNTLATAVQSQPSIKLPAGAYYESPYGGCPTTAISIIGATTAQAFSAREW